jgi:hydrogenase maturation factor
LQNAEADGGPDAGECCVTCADAAVAMRVEALAGTRAACRDADGGLTEVATDFVTGLEVGDLVLVHGGIALARIAPGGHSVGVSADPNAGAEDGCATHEVR